MITINLAPASTQSAAEIGGSPAVTTRRASGPTRPRTPERCSPLSGVRGASLRERIEDNSVPIPFCGCRLWLGQLTEKGYPTATIGGKPNVRVHRLSLELKLGRKLRRNVFACHTCDVRCCVNPDHLFPGTNRTNVADKCAKGRQARVGNGGGVRLDFERAAYIRALAGHELHGPYETNRALARRLGVSERQVERIRKGDRWAASARQESEAAE